MLRVRDAKSGGTCLEPIKTGHSWVFQVSYSPDNTKIATCGTGEGRVRIWNSKTGNRFRPGLGMDVRWKEAYIRFMFLDVSKFLWLVDNGHCR
jgi:WD40 repeat protein